jgi:phage terminase small subunit
MGGPGSGRKPLPRETHEQRGTLRNDRHGEKPAVQPNRERPRIPYGLSPRAQTAWRTIVADLEANGILARSDQWSIELLAVAIGRLREARANANTAMRKSDADAIRVWWKIEREALSQARTLVHQLGLSPSARNSLGMALARAQGAGRAGPDAGAEPKGPTLVRPRRLQAVPDGG